jgi:hypothetical protein
VQLHTQLKCCLMDTLASAAAATVRAIGEHMRGFVAWMSCCRRIAYVDASTCLQDVPLTSTLSCAPAAVVLLWCCPAGSHQEGAVAGRTLRSAAAASPSSCVNISCTGLQAAGLNPLLRCCWQWFGAVILWRCHMRLQCGSCSSGLGCTAASA